MEACQGENTEEETGGIDKFFVKGSAVYKLFFKYGN